MSYKQNGFTFDDDGTLQIFSVASGAGLPAGSYKANGFQFTSAGRLIVLSGAVVGPYFQHGFRFDEYGKVVLGTVPSYPGQWGMKDDAAGSLVTALTAIAYRQNGFQVTAAGNVVVSDTGVGAGSAYATAVLADSPSAFWRLDEAAGASTFVDAVAAKNLTKTGTVTSGAAGLVSGTGASVDLPGTASNFLSAASDAAFDGGTAFSLECWLRPDAVTVAANPIARNSAYYFDLSSGSVAFGVAPTFDASRSAGGSIAIGTTYHVVGTYDGANTRIYVNGTIRATDPTANGALPTGTPLRIGTWSGADSLYDGRIDEIATYKSVLSAARVLAHYNAGL